MNSPKASLAIRAFIALLLGIGFYALALGIAALLAWVLYAEFASGRFNLYLTIASIAGIWIILTSLLPRGGRFVAPGPSLGAKDHPRLFAEIERIARATQQPMPQEVYLVHDVNAWVAERSGLLGLNRKRIMGIGLPLLQILNTSQLRAVLAHEFGHYHGGDTALGPAIYRIREGIGRTIQGFNRRGSLLQWPFLWYGNFFMRITNAISRAQEFSADRLAAQVAGAKAMQSGLQAVHQGSLAFGSYWSNEVVPALSAGYHPPIVEGFNRFVQVGQISKALQDNLQKELEKGKTDLYDTHPSLPERLGAIARLKLSHVSQEITPAISLLEQMEGLELGLLQTLADQETIARLKPIAWENVGRQVYVPFWKGRLETHRQSLSNLAPKDFASLGFAPFGQKLLKEADLQGSDAEYTQWVLGAALSLLLHQQGWQVQTLPGEEVVLQKDAKTFKPFSTLRELGEGRLNLEGWNKVIQEAGVAELPLGPAINP